VRLRSGISHATYKGTGEIFPQRTSARTNSVSFTGSSAYRLGNGTKILIITEVDRSVTTVLLPEEY
jgi:hypothetical protein